MASGNRLSEWIERLGSSRVVRVVVLLIVAVSILISAWSMLQPYVDHPVVAYRGVDWMYLDRGLSRIHSFSDTLSWWTDTWCGEVPFWRPLTSYVFWGMKLIWPPDYMLPRQIILIVLHLGFISVAGLFLWRLTKRFWLVMTVLWLFAGFRPWPVSEVFGELKPVFELLRDPKNIPDPLAGIAMMISLILLLRGRWASSLVVAVVSVCFKEIGFTVWPLALLLLSYRHRGQLAVPSRFDYLRESVRRNRTAILMWTGVLAALIVIHLLAVGIGYRIGNNEAWFWRMFLYLGGPVLSSFFMIDPIPSVIATLAAVAIVATQRMRLLPRFLILLLPFIVGIGADVLFLRSRWDISMGQCFLLQCRLVIICAYTVWLLIAWNARHDWPTALLGFSMCVISVAPAFMAAQTLAHTQYVPSVFMELVVAVAVCESARRIPGFLSKLRFRLR